MANGAAVTTVGKGLIAASMVAGHTAKYIQHGTGTATPAAGNTALGTASADTIVAGTESVSASVKYRVVGSVTSGGVQTITEVGLFDDAVPTNMLYREVFTGIVVAPTDTITYTIDISVT